MENKEVGQCKLNLISEAGETERLHIKDSLLSECEELQKINEASDYIQQWVGWQTPSDYAIKVLKEGNLPPGGKKELYKAKSIYVKQFNKMVGVLEVYHGYPLPEALCIAGCLYIPIIKKWDMLKKLWNIFVMKPRWLAI